MSVKWKINSLTSKKSDGGVIEVEWQCEVRRYTRRLFSYSKTKIKLNA